MLLYHYQLMYRLISNAYFSNRIRMVLVIYVTINHDSISSFYRFPRTNHDQYPFTLLTTRFTPRSPHASSHHPTRFIPFIFCMQRLPLKTVPYA